MGPVLQADTVLERQHELRVRLALGAAARRPALTVIRKGLALVVAASVAGLAAALAAARQTASMLFGGAPADPFAMGSVAAVTIAIALVACAVPAWRASRTEPPAALKE